jgi:hypothetical protein
MLLAKYRIPILLACCCFATLVAAQGIPGNYGGMAQLAAMRVQESTPAGWSGQETEPAESPPALEPASWWIGVCCDDPGDLLLKHLKIDGGLVIHCIAPGCPAERAGLQEMDILWKVNDEVVATVELLYESIQAAGGAKLSLQIVREGSPLTVEVSPEPRPSCKQKEPIYVPVAADENLTGEMQAKIREYLQEHAPGTNYQVILVRPAVALRSDDPNGASEPAEIDSPQVLTLSEIEREGVLLSQAEASDEKVLSGCLVRFSRMVDEQILQRKADLTALRSSGLEDDSDVEKTAALEKLKSQIEVLEKMRRLIQNELDSPRGSDPEPPHGPNDGLPQSGYRVLCQGRWS